MITITGGKLTTWRRMAKLAVDRIVERDGRDAPCRTHEIPLGHGGRRRPSCRASRACRTRPTRSSPARYGHAARDVLALAAERGELAQPIARRACPTCWPRPCYAARREQARSVGDVLLRRTRLGLLAGARTLCAPGEQAPERVAAALGGELGWDAARQRPPRPPRSARRPRPRASSWPADDRAARATCALRGRAARARRARRC